MVEPRGKINWEEYTGLNLGYLYELYESYQRNPDAIDSAIAAVFSQAPIPNISIKRSPP
jgi:2-oxoglutarate dehydrogenase complex dehydrogenase (E1) component-like enzyme